VFTSAERAALRAPWIATRRSSALCAPIWPIAGNDLPAARPVARTDGWMGASLRTGWNRCRVLDRLCVDADGDRGRRHPGAAYRAGGIGPLPASRSSSCSAANVLTIAAMAESVARTGQRPLRQCLLWSSRVRILGPRRFGRPHAGARQLFAAHSWAITSACLARSRISPGPGRNLVGAPFSRRLVFSLACSLNTPSVRRSWSRAQHRHGSGSGAARRLATATGKSHLRQRPAAQRPSLRPGHSSTDLWRRPARLLWHSSVGNCGKLVLKRDPSARSLIWGVIAAQLTAIVVYCVWLLAVNAPLRANTGR